MSTRLVITADLHQHIAKWNDLVRAVEKEKPRFVLVAGDLLPKAGRFGAVLAARAIGTHPAKTALN